jgi:beta-lactamase regulating signal transducer with metallopeptidase domain
MNSLPVDIVVKASVLLAAAGLVDVLLGRRGSAAARHLVWSITVAGTLVLPIASYALPPWQVRIPVARTPDASAGRAGAEVPAKFIPPAAATRIVAAVAAPPRVAGDDRTDAPPVARLIALVGLYALYAGGVLILLVRFVREPFVLRRLTHASREVNDPAWLSLFEDAARQSQIGRPVRLLQSAGELMPLTYGTRRPTVVLPASADGWADDRRRAVLLHELAHVARRDCFVQRLTSLACALYWPHPGVWWAARRLRTERELACDDRVLAAGAGPREYAGHLLDLARSLGAVPAPANALGMARARQLEHRLLAVLDAARNRAALHRGGLAVAIAMSIAVLLPMAALRADIVPVDRPTAVGTSAPPSAQAGPQPGAPARPGSQDFTGTWELRPARDAGTVYVSLHTAHSTHGRTMSVAQLEALTGTRIAGGNGAIHVPIRRESGTFTVDGVCRGGICGGTYVFEPSPAFPAELAKRGIGAPTAQEQYELAIQDVGVAWLDELAADGYQKPDVHGMVRAAEHGVTLDYVRGMAGLGYRLGTLDALITLRDHGVDPEYVRGMTANGFPHLASDDLVRARDHGVDPAYVKGMRDLGYELKDLARVIMARDHGVDPEFANGLAALGFKNIPLDRLIGARDHGVDPQYVRGMRDLGHVLTLDGLTRTRDHGIDPEYVRGLAALGYTGLTVETLVGARDHGVDPEFIRGLAALGYKTIPLDTLIRMRDHGVDPEYVRRLQQRGSGHLSVDELIQRRDRGDEDPNAAARATAAWLNSFWNSRVVRIAHWLRG